ncbi:hypothetical protein FVEG_03541 [Fusarium verticillioides 7600]|uniref:Uncharacterized protein n=1 Tax=Gibberella moniliformis (strain M3125 / FGSC 7600) TaxID=334819 RepID=W7M932_GIBM7|nr:hypothetical protein FVEG_03541 [Fusarium verticillioides 7600]EWG41417.1 hypothetical protein FVEG_03541 [Fusarium verticillioides 7600]
MPSDIFNWLPPEIHINIVKNLKIQAKQDLLRDIRSFISASPIARRYFFANQRASIVRPYIQDVYRIFGDEAIVPLAVILLQVRKVRAQTRGLTSLQIEQRIRPYLDAFSHFENSVPEERWKEDLGCITALISMNREFDEIWHEFSDYIWKMYYWRIMTPRRNYDPPSSYRSTVINHFLRYDLYCQIGYHGEDKLFAENEHVKELESHLYKLMPLPTNGRRMGRLNMLCLIKDILHGILWSVDWQINYVRDERNQVDDIIRQGGTPEFVMQRLRECRFKSRQKYDTKLFLDHVCLQGFPLVFYLKQLGDSARKACILDMFFKTTTEKLQSQAKAGMRMSTRSATKRESIYSSLTLS